MYVSRGSARVHACSLVCCHTVLSNSKVRSLPTGTKSTQRFTATVPPLLKAAHARWQRHLLSSTALAAALHSHAVAHAHTALSLDTHTVSECCCAALAAPADVKKAAQWSVPSPSSRRCNCSSSQHTLSPVIAAAATDYTVEAAET